MKLCVCLLQINNIIHLGSFKGFFEKCKPLMNNPIFIDIFKHFLYIG